MARNKLIDLNNHLFETLERLNDDELMSSADNSAKEIQRAKAVSSVAQAIINNANTMLETVKGLDDYGYTGDRKETLLLLGVSEED